MIDRARLAELRASEEKRFIELHPKSGQLFEKSKVKVLKHMLKGVAHLFVILTDYRDELIEHLKKNNIQYGIHYPVSDHRQEIYKDKFKDVFLPVTESSVNRILSIPIYPGMKQEEINHVINVISNF
jgi:dTDP-4-amino-4,6-dideoxygalactose transaminase